MEKARKTMTENAKTEGRVQRPNGEVAVESESSNPSTTTLNNSLGQSARITRGAK